MPESILEKAKQLLAKGEQAPAGDPPENDFLSSARSLIIRSRVSQLLGGPAGSSVSVERPRNPGVVGSFVHGAKSGLKESLFMKGTELAGVDSAPEKTAQFLGYMTGLGVGFVPYAKGTGLVLKGIGMTKAVEVGSPLYNFTRNVIAGGVQGTSISVESESDYLARDIALGATAGALVEGFFLSKAMRARAPLTTAPPPQAATQLAKELAVTPAEGMQPEKIVTALNGMKPEDFNLDKVLADMAETHDTTVRIPFTEKTEEIVKYAKARLPSAQVLQSGNRVLIHNPLDPSDALSQAQMDQWMKLDVFENMQVTYNGKNFAATGVDVGPDRIQLRDPNKKGLVFSPKRSEVTVPVNPMVYSAGLKRQGLLNQIINASRDQIGFVIPTQNPDYVRRGVVNTAGFETAKSLADWAKVHAPTAKLIPGLKRDGTLEELLESYARVRNIPGLVIRNEQGMTERVYIFDQSLATLDKTPSPTFRYERRPTTPISQTVLDAANQSQATVNAQLESMGKAGLPDLEQRPAFEEVRVPNIGLVADQAVIASDPVTGKQSLKSFVPSWKNAILPNLKAAGIPEKEINSYLELYTAQMGKRIKDLYDPKFKNIVEAGEKQFFEGCQ